MCDPRRAGDAQLVKIETPTFTDAVILYHRLKRDSQAYRYAAVTHYWDATKQVMFELIVRRYHQSHDHVVPKLTYRWFNSTLQVIMLPELRLPVITFDIETVSTILDRVPTGEDINDVLFTVSVHHVDAHTVYSLVYLPLAGRTPQSLKEEMLRLDSYPDYYGTETNVLEVFTSEVDLLRRTVDLLHLNGRHHYLAGYNSLSYDIKYLLVRCHFYGLHTDRFVWKNGYTFGFDQIHVDMFRIAMMRYTYKKYTLGNVARQLLKDDDKVDVDAVALRYTFHRMKKRQRLYAHDDDPEGAKNKWPSLRDTLHYNNCDTLLVSKLIERTRAVDYLVDYAHECRVPLSSMNVNYNKMQYKVMNECLVLGLGRRKFLATFKTSTTADMAIPLPDLFSMSPQPPTAAAAGEEVLQPHDYVVVSQDLDTLITNTKPIGGGGGGGGNKTKTKYPGGANFCLGQYNVANVQSYDYRIAYPLLIDRKNLSDETADVLPADKLAFMYDYIFGRQQYTVYDYMTHVGDTKSKTKVMYYQYLYCGATTYCGGQFPFTKCELQRRGTAPVIVVWHGRRGVMSSIITVFNDNRENTKNRRKTLDGVLAKVETTLQEYIELEEYAPPNTVAVESTADNGGNDDDDGMFVDDDDDDDFGCGELPEVVTSTLPPPPPPQLAPSQPQNNTVRFRFFDSDIIQVFDNGLCFVDETALRRTAEPPVAVLKRLLHDVAMERDECDSSYRLQKSRVASIYGCIGSLKPRLAALVTCMIRTTLLQSGRYLVESHGCTVYYCDTDSLFIVNPSGENMSTTLNQMHPHTEIEMKSIERCMFVQTKIYYYWSDGKIKYGHNTNGPRAWHDMVEHFANLTTITTVGDVYSAFVDFFTSVYRHIVDSPGGLDDLLRVTQDVKIQSNYKTMTPANELKIYLSANYPALAGAYRQNVYYYRLPQDIAKTVYRPSVELVRTKDACASSPRKLRRLKLKRLRRVNLFKYYYNMFKTIFNIVKFHVKINNEPYNVTLNDANVRLIMLRAYLDVTENGTLEQMQMALDSSDDDDDDDDNED